MKKSIIDQLLEETRQSGKQTEKLSQIDEAAIELFSEKGFANTSTKEIAIKAKVAEGTIFKHYKTKDNLLLNLLLKFLIVLLPVIKKDITKKLNAQEFETIEDFMRYFIMERIEFVRDNHDIFRIFVKELIYNDALREKLTSDYFSEVAEIFNDYFDLFKAKGQLRDIDNALILNRMLKIFLADVVWVYVLTDRYKTIDINAWTEILIQQFLHGITQEGEL